MSLYKPTIYIIPKWCTVEFWVWCSLCCKTLHNKLHKYNKNFWFTYRYIFFIAIRFSQIYLPWCRREILCKWLHLVLPSIYIILGKTNHMLVRLVLSIDNSSAWAGIATCRRSWHLTKIGFRAINYRYRNSSCLTMKFNVKIRKYLMVLYKIPCTVICLYYGETNRGV